MAGSVDYQRLKHCFGGVTGASFVMMILHCMSAIGDIKGQQFLIPPTS
jgi:hypothetical protein